MPSLPVTTPRPLASSNAVTSTPRHAHDLGDRDLQQVRGSGVSQGGDQQVDRALVDDTFDGEACSAGELGDGGRLRRGKHGEHGLVPVGGDVELDEHLGPRIEGTIEQRHQLTHRVALVGVGVRLRVGDHLGVADEHRVDDPQAGGPQRPARLGDLDHTVGDVGDLRLARSVAQPDVCIDAVAGEVAPGQLRVLGGHPDAGWQLLDGGDRRVVGDGDDELDRLRGRLRVAQLAERDDVAGGLLDPVATGDPDVEQSLGDVHGDLLRAQDAHLVDPRVVDRGAVGDRRRPHDAEVGSLEQLQRGPLQRPLGQHDPQHRQRR